LSNTVKSASLATTWRRERLFRVCGLPSTLDGDGDQCGAVEPTVKVCAKQLVYREVTALISTEVDSGSCSRVGECHGVEVFGDTVTVIVETHLHGRDRARYTQCRTTGIRNETDEELSATRK